MLIVDSQVHIWTANTPERPWIPGRKPHRDVPLDLDSLLGEMATAGVNRAVLVPTGLDGDRHDLVLEAARLYPDRFAVMGRIDLEATDARRQIAILREQKNFMGLRFAFQRPRLMSALHEGRVAWLWEEAEKADVPLLILVTHEMIPFIDRIAQRHPRLKLILDHLALPMHKKDTEAFRNLDLLLNIARRPNVAVKASALPVYTEDRYPYRSLHSYLRRVCNEFGPKRVFWGSDLSRLRCTYRECVTMFTEEMPWLSGDELEWIMGRGLCAWLGWKPVAPRP